MLLLPNGNGVTEFQKSHQAHDGFWIKCLKDVLWHYLIASNLTSTTIENQARRPTLNKVIAIELSQRQCNYTGSGFINRVYFTLNY